MEKVIITIARQYGSGGKTIGETLARDLGINCYDRELMRLASDESGIAEGLFGKADEKLKNSPLIRITKNVYKGQLIPPESDEFTSNDNLFNYQAKVIRQLAEAESCVIIGRSADYILKDREDVLRIFIYSPNEVRIKNVMESHNLSEPDAKLLISEKDKRYHKRHLALTGSNRGDRHNRDMLIDSSLLGVERTASYIETLAKELFAE